MELLEVMRMTLASAMMMSLLMLDAGIAFTQIR
jgi:hypothetical protein